MRDSTSCPARYFPVWEPFNLPNKTESAVILHEIIANVPNEIEDDMLKLIAVKPVGSDPEEGKYIRASPAIYTQVNAPRIFL